MKVKKEFAITKKIVLFLCTAMIAIVLFGCGSNTPAPPAQSETPSNQAATRELTDMNGNKVEIPTPENIERVAVLTSPQVQIMYIIGMQDKLCAMTASQYRYTLFEKFYPRQADIPAPRRQAADINIEELIASDPQFCIGSETDMDLVRQTTPFPTIDITSASGDPSLVFETRKEEIAMYGEIFGAQDRARKYADYLDSVLARLKEATKSVQEKELSVYMGFNADHLTTYGGDTYMQYQIAAAGLTNAAGEIESAGGREGGLITVSPEQILSWNPDIIIIDSGSADELKADAAWQTLNAVQNGRVYILPVGAFIWNRPSPESAVLLPMWLGITAYPDLFTDTTAEDEVKKCWKEIFGFDLSDEDVDSILFPVQAPQQGGGPGGGSGGGPGGGGPGGQSGPQ